MCPECRGRGLWLTLLVTLKDVDIVSVFIMSRSMNSMILTLNLSESYNPDTDSGVAEIVVESR